MDLRVFTEPQQGATYDTLLEVAIEAERLGFDGFFRSDHYLHMGSVSGLPGPTDAWITLAALARETHRIRLGTLMTAATFRYPGPLSIAVAQVDEMSQGRVELGIGTGWFATEHSAYGIPFPSLAERFDRLEEQIQIVIGLWQTPADKTFDFHGTYYELADSPARPKPVQQPHPPILIGGGGERRTPRLAARFASEFNLAFRSREETQRQFERVDKACDEAGRDPGSIVLSAAQVLCLGEDEAQVERRAKAIGRDVAELRQNGLAGTVDEVTDKLGTFGEIGARRVYLQVLDVSDLDHLRLVAERVLPAVR
ncbi:MAG TPA: LLM class F420-dependent oxidoreductase [Acidimicrobiales bacterium]|nr:LLM class F420-dependent oxidoreductase [Acidimicrobiales bacterium]